MTHTMMFDSTVAGDRGRFPPLGEVWLRLLRGLLSLLRAEGGTGGTEPPGERDQEPGEPARPAAVRLERSLLATAYEAKLYQPTYEALIQPDPPPNNPPDQPDPPPSGYQLVELKAAEDGTTAPDRRPWPFLLLDVLRKLFPDGAPPAEKSEG